MLLTSQAQQTALAISRYLISLLSITGDAYNKILRLKAYSGTLKNHLSSTLDYTEVNFFHPTML